MRKLVATSLLAGALVGGGLTASAGATSHPTLSTTTRTEVLISPKCYAEHQVTTTYFHFVKSRGGYVAYPAPKRTVTDSTVCHA